MATETTTAAQSNAEVALAWIQRGLRLREQKQWSEALESFEKALALDPRSAQGWALKGRVLDEMNNLSEAIRCYKTSLDLNPNSVRVVPIFSSALSPPFLPKNSLPSTLTAYCSTIPDSIRACLAIRHG